MVIRLPSKENGQHNLHLECRNNMTYKGQFLIFKTLESCLSLLHPVTLTNNSEMVWEKSSLVFRVRVLLSVYLDLSRREVCML